MMGERHGPVLDGDSDRQPPAPADAQAIINLFQLYTYFTDLNRGAQLEALFTPDAIWDGTAVGYGRTTGPQQIAREVLSHYRAESPMMHIAGPPILIADGPDRVHALQWCVATRYRPEGLRSPICFDYEDVVVRTEQGWRFFDRRLLLRLPLG